MAQWFAFIAYFFAMLPGGADAQLAKVQPTQQEPQAQAQAPAPNQTPVPRPDCMPHDKFAAALTDQGAEPVFLGNTSTGGRLEIWSKGDDWLAGIVLPDGSICPVSGGDRALSREFACVSKKICPPA